MAERNNSKIVVVAGETGYIGKVVVAEAVRRGFQIVALVRKKRSAEDFLFNKYFQGAVVLECDVTNPDQLLQALQHIPHMFGGGGAITDEKIDTLISCLAAPSGYRRDVYAIDYQATLHFLQAVQASGARHFILLSAFCVRKPLLHLQKAKLKMEAALKAQPQLTWTIVRPTAFFKSMSRQFDKVRQRKRYLAFGDGEITRCNPIAESDLAAFMLDCITYKNRENQTLNIGGNCEPLTHRKNASIMAKVANVEPARMLYVPICWLAALKYLLEGLTCVFPKSETLENAAEMTRLVHYYASESMLTTEECERYGTTTMQDHYEKILFGGKDKDERMADPSELILSGMLSTFRKRE